MREAFATLKRTVSEFMDDHLIDWAAALTFYGVLSIFPALIVVVSILGMLGQSGTQPLIENLEALAPGSVTDILEQALSNIQNNQGAAGLLFFVGLGIALWTASGYIAAFIRASNAIWDVEEGRPIWKTLPLRIGLTLLMLILLVITILAVVLTGPIAQTVGDVIGLGDEALTAWDYGKWPFLVVIVALMFALLYYIAPNVQHPRFQWVSAGSVVAVVTWIVASIAFAIYVSNFGSYNKTYGSLGAVIIFLVWLWISNIAILFGGELNAEIERKRQIERGHPPEEEPYLPPRDPAES